MANDNVQTNPGAGGPVIRSIGKTANVAAVANPLGAQTQIVAIDVGGGADGSPETPLTLGQAVKAASLPVVLASDQGAILVSENNNPVGPGAFATSQAPITTTSSGAALAARAGAAGAGRVSVTIYNLGSATAYLGNSTSVSASNGLPILPGGSYTKRTTAALYAVTSTGSTTLAFDEEF